MGMSRAVHGSGVLLIGTLLCACATLPAQQQQQSVTPPQYDEKGEITVNGHVTPYRIRRLPVSSFPDMPATLAELLTERGCLIPQTYQAHGPENVVHASLEQAETSDWAVLCSTHGTVSLLVYFANAPSQLITLAEAQESERLQAHTPSGVLGFNWGIDPATPQNVHQAQAGLNPRPPMLDHDALAETIIDHRTTYHFHVGDKWTTLNTSD
jgi:hypothetical protein